MTSLASAHGGDPDMVHACVDRGSGQVRVIDPNETCRKGETALDWSLGTGLVTGDELAPDSVDSSKVVQESLRDEDLAENSVGTAEIKSGAVGSDEVGNEALTSEHLAANSVGTSELVQGAVLAEDLASSFLSSLVTEAEFTGRLSSAAPSGAPNNVDSIVDWSKLKNVPSGFADNIDNDGSSALNDFKNELKNSGTPDTAVNGTGDPVSWFRLRDVPGGFVDGADNVDGGTALDLNCSGCLTAEDLGNDSVEGTEIKNGTITAADLAGSDTDTDHSIAGDQTIPGAVTSEKIQDDTIESRDISLNTITADDLAPGSVTSSELADGTIETADLKDGAVTTAKVKANAGIGTGGMTIAATSGQTGDAAMAAVDIADSAGHSVLLTGQSMVTCSCSAPGDSVSFDYELQVDGRPLAPAPVVYQGRVGFNAPATISTSSLHSPAAPGTRFYKIVLRITGVTAGGSTAPTAVTLSGGLLTAVDLGRAP